MAACGLVLDPRFLDHLAGVQHVESPARLESIQAMLQEAGLDRRLVKLPPRRATRAELETVHSPAMIDLLAETASRDLTTLDPDTLATRGSFEAALLAAGGGLALIDAALGGRIETGFGLVRPPGHHATPRRPMGFCLVNNVAVAAAHALLHHHLSRVLIVDWDVHHGNGTQEAFYQRPEVLYFSVHQYPHYPGSGGLQECGAGPGEGFTVNVPLSGGYGDGDYAAIFRRILAPVADAFRPQLVLVSAGFDASQGDPLGDMGLTPAGFAALARIVRGIAARHAGGRALFMLEGGYALKGLVLSVHDVIHELLGDPPPGVDGVLSGRPTERGERIIAEVIKVQRRYWPQLVA